MDKESQGDPGADRRPGHFLDRGSEWREGREIPCWRSCLRLSQTLLYQASAETLLEVARNPRRLGAEIGFFSVLHTWNQKLQLHPHVHCVVPAGGLSLDHTRWIPSRPRFFLPLPVLRRRFRGKVVAGLKSAFQHQQLHFAGDLAPIAQPKIFASWLRPLFRKNWVVYCKPPFGGPEYVLQYLGRYTHRVAISNHRLISLADGQVTFRWRDSAHHNEQKVMSLSLDEFLRRRFLLHLLPKGFVRIRHFGFLANRRRTTLLPLCRQALAVVQPQTQPEASAPKKPDRFGSVLTVAGRWWSSRGLRRLRSSSVRHPFSPEPPHETTIPSSPTRCPLPPAGVVRPACPRTIGPFPTSTQDPVPTTSNVNQSSSAFAVSNSSSCSRSLSHSSQDH